MTVQNRPEYSADEVACYIDPYRAILDKKDFATTIEVPFENTTLYAPVGYDEILRRMYGDYMKFPPKDKQVPHHIIDMYWK